jgi:hypothetical protein
MFTPNDRPAAKFSSITCGKMYWRRVIGGLGGFAA